MKINIYVAHSSDYDYENKLYKPIRNCKELKQYNFFLPHEVKDRAINSKDIIKEYDLVIAEVSYPSTGLGIELGWAENFSIPILCIYQKNSKYSGSLKFITDNFIEYEDSDDLVNKINEFIKERFG